MKAVRGKCIALGRVDPLLPRELMRMLEKVTARQRLPFGTGPRASQSLKRSAGSPPVSSDKSRASPCMSLSA